MADDIEVTAKFDPKAIWKWVLWGVLALAGSSHVGGSWWESTNHGKEINQNKQRLDDIQKQIAELNVKYDALQAAVQKLSVVPKKKH